MDSYLSTTVHDLRDGAALFAHKMVNASPGTLRAVPLGRQALDNRELGD